MVGVILGLVLGIGLVFAREAFDTRIRSAEQVAAELGFRCSAACRGPTRTCESTTS